MAITIDHNPDCGTPRSVLDVICNSGVEPVIFQHLKTLPSCAVLTGLIGRNGIGVRGLLRQRGAFGKRDGAPVVDAAGQRIAKPEA